MRGITHVIYFCIRFTRPRYLRNQVSNPRIALPPAFLGIIEFTVAAKLHRFGGVGDVKDLMAFATRGAQQIGLVGITFRSSTSIANAGDLRAPLLIIPRCPRNMIQIARMRGIGDVHDRRAVEFLLPRQRIGRLWNVRRAAVMTYKSNVSIALVMNCRLIGTTALKVVVSDQPHVHRLGRGSYLLFCCRFP